MPGPALLVPYPHRTDAHLFQMSGGQVAGTLCASRHPVPSSEAVHLNVREEQVQFHNGDVTLAGTLLLPPAGTRHPAYLVFAHGSGAGHAARVVLGFWLSYGPRVVSRCWRSTNVEPVGRRASCAGASFEDLADDVAAGARFLQSRREVDARRIGFWGLSQGAWIAPMAAVALPCRRRSS